MDSLHEDNDLPKKRTRTFQSKQKIADNEAKKILRDFDPQRSEREKRKNTQQIRRLYPGSKKHVLYDESGIFMQNGMNLCDCLRQDCPGCHYPCPKCGSTKCGHECRIHRRWAYECIENEGSDTVTKNRDVKKTF
ncbi:ARL14 effector protein [Diachasma alloeum]|uniref:ARL14 effector protein n=1 Tax=Diachasma alloeum TaxID=454923 RepID=UPI0007385144|nr:ARL14 effector protein [Diachasma alloeum]